MLKDVKERKKRQIVHDFRVNTRKARQNMLPIYGRTPYCFQMDTLEQSYRAKADEDNYGTTPPYFLVLININSRKGYAYPMTKKKAEIVSFVLNNFLRTHKVTHIYTDNDPAYTEQETAEVINRFKVHHTKTNNDNKHVLGIINRFIKTIRDKNGLERDITVDAMNKILREYNDTVHSSTGVKPNDWTKELNDAWIERKHREMIGKQGADDIRVNDYVRIPTNHNVFAKIRAKFDKEAYPITGIDGNRFQVLKNGEVITFSRFQLRRAESYAKRNDSDNLEHLADNVVTKILSYHPEGRRYWCLWERGEPGYCTVRNLRGTDPHRLTLVEREFWNEKTEDEIPPEIRALMPRYAKPKKKQRVKLVYTGPKTPSKRIKLIYKKSA